MKFLCVVLFATSLFAAELTFEEALIKAEENSALLNTVQKRLQNIDATRSLYLKGSAPEIELSTENLGLSEVELAVSKELRSKEQKAPLAKDVEIRKRAVALPVTAERLEIHREMATLYVSLSALDESEQYVDSIRQSLERELTVLKKRFAAGAASELELLEQEQLIMEMDEQAIVLKSENQKLKSNLNYFWSDEVTLKTEPLEVLLKRLSTSVSEPDEKHPQLLELHIRKQEASLLELQAIALQKPDWSVQGGYKRNNEAKEHAFLLGVSLGLKSKGEASIVRAEASLLKNEIVATRVAVLRELTNKLTLLDAEIAQKEMLLDRLVEQKIPLAKRFIAAAHKRYAKGVLSIADKIRYRRELFDLQLEKNELVKETIILYIQKTITSGKLLNQEKK